MSIEFSNKSFVITGTFKEFERKEIEEIITSKGGVIKSSVSSKTDYLICGEKAGSKLAKAEELGITIISEEEFKNSLNNRENQMSENKDYGYVSKEILENADFDEDVGLAKVKKDGKWGLIDKAGNEVVPFKSEKIQCEYFNNENDWTDDMDNLYIFEKDGKYGLCDIENFKVFLSECDYIDSIILEKNNGLGKFIKGDKWGFFDKTGKVINTPLKDLLKVTVSASGEEVEQVYAYLKKDKMKEILTEMAEYIENDSWTDVMDLMDTYILDECGRHINNLLEDNYNFTLDSGNDEIEVEGYLYDDYFDKENIEKKDYGICFYIYSIADYEGTIALPFHSLDDVKEAFEVYEEAGITGAELPISIFGKSIKYKGVVLSNDWNCEGDYREKYRGFSIYKGNKEILSNSYTDEFLDFIKTKFGIEVKRSNETESNED